MYYVTFVLDDRRLLIQKLAEFVTESTRPAYLYRDGLTQTLSLASVPEPIGGDFYPNFWFVHGAPKTSLAPSEPFEVVLYARRSLEETGNLFDRFANSFSWTLFPWGGRSSYRLMGFISSEESPSERFRSQFAKLIVSHYEVESGIESVFKGIIFEEQRYHAGLAVWNACSCSVCLPYVVFYQYDKEVISASILESDFDVLRTFSIDSDTGTLLSVYRPHDLRSYSKLVNDHASVPDTLVVLPDTTDLDVISALLGKTESKDASCDLQNVQTFLDKVRWYYAVGRNHQDWPYSLFVARDSGLVERVARQGDLVDLIACL